MPYIIDGHNLVPHVPGLSLSDPDDESALIRIIQAFCTRKNVQAEIFFDRAAPGQSGRRKYGRVGAVFVPHDQTADAAIIRRLKSMRRAARNAIVVSSDRRVQVEARAQGAAILESGAFASQLEAASAQERADQDAGLSDNEVREWLALFGDEQAGQT